MVITAPSGPVLGLADGTSSYAANTPRFGQESVGLPNRTEGEQCNGTIMHAKRKKVKGARARVVSWIGVISTLRCVSTGGFCACRIKVGRAAAPCWCTYVPCRM